MANNEVHQPLKTGPQFFYGYIVVAAAFFILLVSFGLYNSFGVFFKPMLNELGWSRAVTSGSFSLSMLIYGVLSIVMGGLADRFGPRVVVTLCGVLLGIGYLLMSQVNPLWQLYLFYGVVIGIGMSGVWVPQMSSVARWFISRRSLMTGIVVAGTSIGGLIGPPVVSRLIATYDWRLSFIMVGAAGLVITVLAAQFLRRDPSLMGQKPYGEDEEKQPGLESETNAFSFKEAVPTLQFWLVGAILFCLGFCMFSTVVHIVPHATDQGMSAVNAAGLLAIISGMGIPGNLVLGGAADRIGNRWVFIIGFILMAATLFWMVLAREIWMFYLFAVVFGFALGGCGACESPITARLFGLSAHGMIYGVVHLGFAVGAAVGPFLTGYIFDVTGSYQTAFVVSAAVGAAGFISAAMIRPTKRLAHKI